MTAFQLLRKAISPPGSSWRFLVLPAALFSVANTDANEQWWVLSASDAEGNSYLIDGLAKLEMGSARTYHAHFFYRVPVDGVSSAQIEFYVDCAEGMLREARYKDFDAQRVLLETGDNTEINAFRSPIPGSIGDQIVRFSCADEEVRTQRYAKIASNVDLWALGEFLAQGSRPQTTNQP